MNDFRMRMVDYHHFNLFPSNFFIKRVFRPMFYKTDFGVLKFKNLLLKTKQNLLN
jgi:hypothetical protein